MTIADFLSSSPPDPRWEDELRQDREDEEHFGFLDWRGRLVEGPAPAREEAA